MSNRKKKKEKERKERQRVTPTSWSVVGYVVHGEVGNCVEMRTSMMLCMVVNLENGNGY